MEVITNKINTSKPLIPMVICQLVGVITWNYIYPGWKPLASVLGLKLTTYNISIHKHVKVSSGL